MSQIGGCAMWRNIDSAMRPLFRLCQNLDREQWVIVFAVALTVGYFCLRGFGSRSKY